MSGVLAIDTREIERVCNDPHGEVARALLFETVNTVYWYVKDTLATEATYTVLDNGWRVWQENKPHGPPLQRTGRLWSSVAWTMPKRDATGLHCDITVHSIPRMVESKAGDVRWDDHDYVKLELIDKDYWFVREGDPHYQMVPREPGQ